MIKKFIIKGVSKKFKGLQKLKPQKTPSRFTSVMSEATVKANQRKVLGDVPEFMGLSSRSVGNLASESLALKTANKTFFKSLNKGLKQSRARTATGIKTFRQTKKVPKLAVTKAKSKGALKAYKAANIKSEKVFRNTMDKFTGKSKTSPFVNRSIKPKDKTISQGVLKQMGLDDREYFNPKSGKTFINTVRGDFFKKK
jgi:hypothetical protein